MKEYKTLSQEIKNCNYEVYCKNKKEYAKKIKQMEDNIKKLLAIIIKDFKYSECNELYPHCGCCDLSGNCFVEDKINLIENISGKKIKELK